MNIVISIDSFKGSVSSMQAGNSIKHGILKVYPNACVSVFPLADGGEGTVDALCSDEQLFSVKVNGPLMQEVTAKYGLTEDKTAVIEIAQAVGLPLVPTEKRNPLYTSSYGVGQIIKDAIKNGARKFIIGIGGSSTNDGGIGMLSALGFEFMDKDGKPVNNCALGLADLYSINTDKVMPELSECTFEIACDVDNPLCGERGCSAVFSPQKGALPEDIVKMDKWLEKYALLSKVVNPNADKDRPGAGAAGGLGFAFNTFLNSSLHSGIEIITDHLKIEKTIKEADIVITGEGRLDSQTVMGKAPMGITKLAKKYDIPVIGFCGCVSDDASICNENGIDAFFPALRKIVSLEDALDVKNTIKNLSDTAEQVFRLIKSLKKV